MFGLFGRALPFADERTKRDGDTISVIVDVVGDRSEDATEYVRVRYQAALVFCEGSMSLIRTVDTSA